MQFANRYIDSAAAIISNYDGSVPLHHHLKQFFAAEKKFGSRDRKAISHACYCYYRLGHSLKQLSITDRLRAAIFLCTEDTGPWAGALPEQFHAAAAMDVNQKAALLAQLYGFEMDEVFPWQDELSEGIDKQAFTLSHLIQPDLHLRLRPGKAGSVEAKLKAAGIEYRLVDENSLALRNGTRIDNLLQLDQEAVVQDLSSQRIAGYFPAELKNKRGSRVWDCCAASGGKSILAADNLPGIDLMVSDLRPSIIHNLQYRFAASGLKTYRSFVADLENVDEHELKAKTGKAGFDLVICDAPCSGSGTWSRNPEQLYFFTGSKIGHYAALQKKIVSNVLSAVAPGGYLLYVTCSVFRQENEDAVAYILSASDLRLQHSGLIKGYEEKADTMFAALFCRLPG